MNSILAIDTAWTATEPTGIALLKEEGMSWSCVALAPSYADFYALAEGKAIDWEQKPEGEFPDINRLLNSAKQLLGQDMISLITVDMPVSTVPILGRREAESAISKAFGAMGCATHSPSPLRPGKIGQAYSEGCFSNGYQLGVTTTPHGQTGHLLEVYPHPALIRLMQADYRLPYKAGKTRKLWPEASVDERKANLMKIYSEILLALKEKIQAIPLDLPDDLPSRPFSYFKRFEDTLDALVCGWIGMKYLVGEALPYGDNTGAIWVPK